MNISIPESLKTKVKYKNEVCIPKIIHQTYISIDKLPEQWKKTPESWQVNNPEWKYVFWSDKKCRKLVKRKFLWFLDIYDNYEYNIQRADAIRYMIMYSYGGIYVDCDIACLKGIDDLFMENSDVYLINTPTANDDTVTNCLMASKAKSNFWFELMKEMMNRALYPSVLWIGKHWKVMNTTGPFLVNYMYNQKKDHYKFHLLSQINLLPPCCNICSNKPCSDHMSYVKLLEGSSWINIDGQIYNLILCNWFYMIIMIGVIYYVYNITEFV